MAKMFTRKLQYIRLLGVKVKGEGKFCELAECVMRRCVSGRRTCACEKTE